MKLFTKYNRINLLSTVIIFLLACIAFYFLLRYILINQVDEDLRIEQHEIETYVQKFEKLPENLPVKDQQIDYTPTATHTAKRRFRTLSFYDAVEKEQNDFRQLIFSLPLKEKWYQVSVSKSLEGTDDMMRSLIIISVITILIILLVSFLINRFILRRLWQPFYNSIDAMKQFRLGQQKPSFSKTGINEFNVLNETLQQSVDTAEKEYRQLKEFTENASHELQTPIAVIRSKLDVLIQDENLSETQSHAVQSAYDALQKLNRLNQSLLLLSKIENRQFSDISTFNFKELVQQKMTDFKELWQDKNISVQSNLNDVSVFMNTELAEILLNNLFSNATRHTAADGEIHILLDAQKLVISNSASSGSLDTDKLFNRFYKGNQSSQQHGLGLSIVHHICTVSGFSIKYAFVNHQHQFSIFW